MVGKRVVGKRGASHDDDDDDDNCDDDGDDDDENYDASAYHYPAYLATHLMMPLS